MPTESSKPTANSTAPIVKRVLAGLGILLLAATGLILIDPFGWHIVDRVRGRYNPALAAIPADSHIYLGVNLSSTNLARLNELWEKFSAATAGTELDAGMFRQEADDWLTEKLDLSIAEDVSPWIGQHIGLALVTIEVNDFGELTAFDWLLTVETEDAAASDQFLQDMATGWVESTQEEFITETYEGTLITQFKRFAFGRSGHLILAGSSASVVRQAIAAQKGESLDAVPGYQEAIRQLPAGRLLTIYVNGQHLNDLITDFPTPLPRISPENLPTAPIQVTALGLSLVDEGIRADTATVYDSQQLTLLQREVLETRVVEPETASFFPADTVLYWVGQGVDLTWASLRRALIAEIGRTDFIDSMQLFAQEFNLNPDEGFFPLLDGEAAFALQPDKAATAGMGMPVNLAATLLIGISDPETLSANIATFSDKIGDPQGGIGHMTKSQAQAGHTMYQFETALLPDLRLTYGVGQGYLMISSSLEALGSLRFDEGPSLAGRTDYQRVWHSFPESMAPGLFVDVAGIITVLQEGDLAMDPDLATLTSWLTPLSYIAAAGQVDDNVSRSTLLLFIEAE